MIRRREFITLLGGAAFSAWSPDDAHRLTDVDPKGWLADVFRCIAEIPQTRLHELLPWEWKAKAENAATAQAA